MNDNKRVKELFGLSLKMGKERAKKLLGRLPNPGREVCIQSGVKNYWEYKVFLQNWGGKLEYHLWFSVNPSPERDYDVILGED